jgi:peroxiredoxin
LPLLGYNRPALRVVQIASGRRQNVRIRSFTAAGVLATVLALPFQAQGTPLKVGDRAPDFALPDQNGNVVKLSDYLGKRNIVLAFYVLAFTGG